MASSVPQIRKRKLRAASIPSNLSAHRNALDGNVAHWYSVSVHPLKLIQSLKRVYRHWDVSPDDRVDPPKLIQSLKLSGMRGLMDSRRGRRSPQTYPVMARRGVASGSVGDPTRPSPQTFRLSKRVLLQLPGASFVASIPSNLSSHRNSVTRRRD